MSGPVLGVAEGVIVGVIVDVAVGQVGGVRDDSPHRTDVYRAQVSILRPRKVFVRP